MPPHAVQAARVASIRSGIADLAVLLGICVFAYGAWLAWKPAGFIVAGLALLVVGMLFGRSAAVSQWRRQ